MWEFFFSCAFLLPYLTRLARLVPMLEPVLEPMLARGLKAPDLGELTKGIAEVRNRRPRLGGAGQEPGAPIGTAWSSRWGGCG